LVEVAEGVDYFFRADPVMDEKAAAKLLVPAAADTLEALAREVAAVEPFERTALDAHVKAWAEKNALALKDVAQPARVALTGRSASPGLFEVMEVLGKERTLERLASGARRARG
jgi:glutamyl-tRNA synthetase